jgi:hypothetical protein
MSIGNGNKGQSGRQLDAFPTSCKASFARSTDCQKALDNSGNVNINFHNHCSFNEFLQDACSQRVECHENLGIKKPAIHLRGIVPLGHVEWKTRLDFQH